jgi:hypothetical protein
MNRLLIICEYCKTQFDSTPKFLPCGWTICESHLNNNQFNNCKFCSKKHAFQANYPTNTQVVFLQTRSRQFNEIQELIKQLEEIKDHPIIIEHDFANEMDQYLEELRSLEARNGSNKDGKK